ncbi:MULTISPECIES: DUF1491 family protein [unclassified Chelatococcus]|jgi:hypothetical protein|uniref:DUF1491 family protein n=1 Tax=unclassified Chelatococcus TaxID=2638111 RepID=UPI001BCC4FD8|nr:MULTISPECIES: DUF1491 family protein [unclassified Chelatococcus]CAH1669387.1 conserved hypothetical protein [Hyphomicrobiales bacterium]MBS7739341.1 DUF1491 family protein [Chelatococcus sp. HY11]MBX3546620.1 DUF1491 family protein [Chelatococcus sp.]MCO5076124.1 DUF1491 family protein [Chelatococcus sp.]CAH1679162.1 conserved hypothetical protein [Hyphomicrobiales bacterium]
MRLRTDFWVPAYIRRCSVEGAYAVLRRRGAAEAGAVFVKIDPLDGTCALYGPAPQSLTGDQPEERFFLQIPLSEASPLAAEEKLRREIAFDPDLWIVEVEDREGRHFLDLAKE